MWWSAEAFNLSGKINGNSFMQKRYSFQLQVAAALWLCTVCATPLRAGGWDEGKSLVRDNWEPAKAGTADVCLVSEQTLEID